MELLYQGIYDLLDMLPSLPSLPDLTDATQFMIEFITSVSYFIPLEHLLLQILLSVSISNFHFIYSLALKIWNAIPFV